jgi:hypothetical protein
MLRLTQWLNTRYLMISINTTTSFFSNNLPPHYFIHIVCTFWHNLQESYHEKHKKNKKLGGGTEISEESYTSERKWVSNRKGLPLFQASPEAASTLIISSKIGPYVQILRRKSARRLRLVIWANNALGESKWNSRLINPRLSETSL